MSCCGINPLPDSVDLSNNLSVGHFRGRKLWILKTCF
jgi:hypothetical protein